MPPPVAISTAQSNAVGSFGNSAPDRLVTPEVEAAAAGSVSALLRTLVQERDSLPVYRGGPTIEDLVRDEIRPLLKAWLDTHLPPLVERLVRIEIERVVGRVQP
jgi:cell pole-organizing protein PopZ